MWLINTDTLELEGFQGKPPPYAILSHRWGADKDEVSFRSWNEDHSKILDRSGYIKITKACGMARRRQLSYLWVDTCCIDKSSSSELSEAINSMYRYYAEADVCFAYLSDVYHSNIDYDALNTSVSLPDNGDAIDVDTAKDSMKNRDSRVDVDGDVEDAMKNNYRFYHSSWFTRGWTLQELLAPRNLEFYTADWVRISTKSDIDHVLSRITGIDTEYLRNPRSIASASVAMRMSWVANRVTTRLEDIAYCLLGIFDINIPLIYGEGRKAFQRLQEEILKASTDLTLFLWDILPILPPLETSASTFVSPSATAKNPTAPSWYPILRVAHLESIGWKMQVSSTSAQIGANIGSNATSMLASDPIFFCRRINIPLRRFREVQVPYSLTNMGLSIDLAVTAIPCGHPLIRQSSMEDRLATLALVETGVVHPRFASSTVGDVHYGFLLSPVSGTQYERRSPRASQMEQGNVGQFSLLNRLLLIELPSDAVSRWFTRRALYIRPSYLAAVGEPYIRTGVGIWLLDSGPTYPSIELCDGGSDWQYTDVERFVRGPISVNVATCAVFRIQLPNDGVDDLVAKSEPLETHLLLTVRRPQPGEDDSSLVWACTGTYPVPDHDGRPGINQRWWYSGEFQTRADIETRCIDSKKAVAHFKTVGPPKGYFECGIEGKIEILREPGADIRFLYLRGLLH